jgi:hypothetical protein
MSVTSSNVAAWIHEPKGDLKVEEAPTYAVEGDEILIKVSNHVLHSPDIVANS